MIVKKNRNLGPGKKNIFITIQPFTLLDMTQCAQCEIYFEALLGDSICNSCTHTAEIDKLMHPYRRAAIETQYNRNEKDEYEIGDLLDVFA